MIALVAPFTENQLKRVWELFDEKFYDAEQGAWDDSHPFGTCTYVNAAPINWLLARGHSCEMFGKSEAAFAGQPWDTEFGCVTGHDWLVVDGRWLVDLWISPYLGINRFMFDLDDATDRAQVAHIYGPRGEWEPADGDHLSARCLSPEAFPAALNP